jgi:hypothetical protein
MMQASAFFTLLALTDRPFSEAALDAVRDLAGDVVTEEALMEAGKKEAIKVAGRALQEAPEYLKGLLSWRDQVKRGKFTLYLDTSSLDKQVGTLQSIAALLLVGLLVAGGMIGGALAWSALRQNRDTGAAHAAEWIFFSSVGVAVFLLIVFLARLFRGSRRRP